MKHAIYPEKQGTPTASSEDSNYLATNLIGDSRKEVWKAVAAVETAILRVPISADASVITLHGTNAETAVCAITLDSAEQTLNNAAAVDEGGGLVGIPLTGHGFSEGDVVVIDGTTNYDGIYTLPTQAAGGADEFIITATYAAETFAGTETACIVISSSTHTLETADYSYDRFWQEYTEQSAAHTATIVLTAGSGETVEAGIVRAGALVTMRGPKRSPVESMKNLSILDKMKDGSHYGIQLDSYRTFNYSALMTRSTHFRRLMTVYEFFHPDPFAMLITDQVDDNMYTVFGILPNSPSATHNEGDLSQVSISIEEVV